MTNFGVVALTILAGCSVIYLLNKLVYHRRMRGAKRLPGPRGLPYLGNVLDLGNDPRFINVFNRWTDKYGPIYAFNLMGKTNVVISTEKAARDLLINRGSIYSGRDTPAAVDALVKGNGTPVMPNNDLWKKHRKLIQYCMTMSTSKIYHSQLEIESLYTLRDLFETPKNFDDHFKRYVMGVLSREGLGIKVNTADHPFVQKIEFFNDAAVDSFRVDKYLCNLMPWILRLPYWLVPSNGYLESVWQKWTAMVNENNSKVEKEMQQGHAPESFNRYFLENIAHYGLDKLQGGFVLHGLFMAGTASTHRALVYFISCMLLYPEWQDKMQKEIDEAVGPDRLPILEDLPRLPVVRAVLKEGVRDRGARMEFNIPRQLAKDDIYDGYFIPAGSIIWANVRRMSQDPEIYPDGLAYNPARWLDPSYPTYKAPLTNHPTLQGFPSFGWGRRSCPGVPLAEMELALMIARLMWACSIRKPIDPRTNQEIPVHVEWDNSFNPKALPFEVDFVPRSQAKMDLIRHEAQQALVNDPLA